MRNRRRIVAMAMSILLVTLLATYLLLCFLPVSSHEKSDLFCSLLKLYIRTCFRQIKVEYSRLMSKAALFMTSLWGTCRMRLNIHTKTVFLLREALP